MGCKVKQKRSILHLFYPDPRKRCLLTQVTFEEPIQNYKPTLKSSTATNEIHSGAL